MRLRRRVRECPIYPESTEKSVILLKFSFSVNWGEATLRRTLDAVFASLLILIALKYITGKTPEIKHNESVDRTQTVLGP